MDVHSSRWTARAGWSAPLPAWDSAATLVVVFGPSALLDTPAHPGLRDLLTAYPRAVVTGCSTAGEVLDDALADDSLTVAVLRFAVTRVVAETAEAAGADSHDTGLLLSKRLADAAPDLAAVLVWSDGLGVNGSLLAEGLAAGAPPGTAVVGGLAGDGARFDRTWVLTGGRPRSGAVVAVGLFGDRLQVGHGSRGGWSILGPERVVTRSAGNVLHELDGRPALDLYRTYLGDRAAGLPATALLFPLGVLGPDGLVVRTVLGVDADARTLTFAGDVPQGALVQLMHSSTDRLVDAAEEAAASAALPGGPGSVGLVVSCVGRRLYLGQRTDEELEVVREALGGTTPVVGMYSYGELTTAPGQGCRLENQTMTVTVLRELV